MNTTEKVENRNLQKITGYIDRHYKPLGMVVGFLFGFVALTTVSNAVETDKTSVPVFFDDLDGGSPNIKVYPVADGPSVGEEPNGVYKNGDGVIAECVLRDRIVASDVTAGEHPRASDVWVYFSGRDGLGYFATAVYLRQNVHDFAGLPGC